MLALLAVMACHAEAPAEARDVPDVRASVDTTSVRARAAGLNAEQEANLERLGFPIVVPDLLEGWKLTRAVITVDGEPVYGEWVQPDYALSYQNSDGACLTLYGTRGRAVSIGGVRVSAEGQARIRDVPVDGISTFGPVRVGRSEVGEMARGWDGGQVSTDAFGADGLALYLFSEGSAYSSGGCSLATPGDTEAFLRSLRPLDPADDAALIGEVLRDDFDDPEIRHVSGETLEEAARAAYDSTGDSQTTTVRILRQRPDHAIALVTGTDLADDAVRDLRARVALTGNRGSWNAVACGWQFRCQPGRGAQDWSASACV